MKQKYRKFDCYIRSHIKWGVPAYSELGWHLYTRQKYFNIREDYSIRFHTIKSIENIKHRNLCKLRNIHIDIPFELLDKFVGKTSKKEYL